MNSEFTLSAQAQNFSSVKRALLEKKLRPGFRGGHGLRIIPRRPEGVCPLSFAQQRLWLLLQLDPTNAAYNILSAVQISGELDIGVVEKSVNEIIRRHEVLRTRFVVVEEQPLQIIESELRLSIKVQDFSNLSTLEKAELIKSKVRQEGLRPFDLDTGPLLRVELLYLGQKGSQPQYILMVTLHHIISDGWSASIWFREFVTLYLAYKNHREPNLPLLPIQYSDFSCWQREWLGAGALEKQLGYWKAYLKGIPPLLELPTDRPRPVVQSSRGATYNFDLPADLVSAMHNVSRSQGATLFSVLLAAFFVLLGRYSKQFDICVGVPVANRNRVEIEGLIGFFVNTLIMRADLSGNPSFFELLHRIHEDSINAQSYQDLPFEKLVEELQPPRDLSYSPLFQVMFVLHNVPVGQLTIPGLSVEVLDVDYGTSKFDLLLHITEKTDGIRAAFEYATDLFDEATIQRMTWHFRTLLEGIVEEPKCPVWWLPLLPLKEYRHVVDEWNRTAVDFPEHICFHRLFERQAHQTPNRIAVEFEDQAVDYRTLNCLANRVAHALVANGVGTDTVVAVIDERGIDLLAMILGIFKAGGAYLPLDPNHPPARLMEILKQSQSALIVAGRQPKAIIEALAFLKPEMCPVTLRLSEIEKGKWSDHEIAERSLPNSLAYVIYTSGSTGVPKGAMLEQRGMLNNVWSKLRWLGLSTKDVIGQSASQCFDISVWQFLSGLLCGARIRILPDSVTHDPWLLLQAVETFGITVLEVVPSMLRTMLSVDPPPKLANLRWLLPTGEELPPDVCRDWFRRYPTIPLLNAYGPAECSDDVALCCINEAPAAGAGHMPIGRPNDNLRIYILDAWMQPQPIGVPGEIYVGGVGVGRGYLNDPSLTAAAFLPDPFGLTIGARLYKTGDLGRFLADGTLEFLSRVDHQVKLRGFRIELGEIEARLARHPEVKESVVLVREDRQGNRRLVAYIVHETESGIDQDQLREFLKAALPEYMIPSAFVFLQQMPLNDNGKIDRLALPVPDFSEGLAASYAAPRTPVEHTLAEIWADLLGLERVGIHDNFFEIGGESVIAIQMVSRANREGMKLTPRHIFQYQTITELAREASQNLTIDHGTPEIQDEAYCLDENPKFFELAELSRDHIDNLLNGFPGIEDIYPATPMQEGMLYHTLLAPGSGIYVMQDRFILQGELNISAFREAWGLTIREHAIMRTSFLWDANIRPHQIVHKDLDIPIQTYDWRDNDKVVQEHNVEELLFKELQAGFDLAKPPLFRIKLFQLEPKVYLFVLSHHHMLLDDWSASVLLADFYQRYDEIVNDKPSRHQKRRSYRDYIAWLKAQDSTKSEAFWRQNLKGLFAPTPLVIDHSPVDLAEGECERGDISMDLSESETRSLVSFAQRHQLTPNTFVQGCWALLLSHYSNQGDVMFGVTVVGRPADLEGMESIVGLFINGLPLRIRIDPNSSVLSWLKLIFEQNVEMRQHEYTPLVKIQEWSEIPRRHKIFSSLLTYENAPIDAVFKKGGMEFKVLNAESRVHTNFPLTLVILPGHQFNIKLSYDRQLFDVDVAERMLRHFMRLLVSMITFPDSLITDLPLLTAKEYHGLAVDWNNTDLDYPEPRDIVAQFEMQAVQTPDAVAIGCEDTHISYEELNRRANRVAHGLIAKGIGPDVIVAILDDRGIDFLITMLGIFKAGGAYLPLEPAHPNPRLVQVLRESQIKFLVSGSAYCERAHRVAGELNDPPSVFALTNLDIADNSTSNPPKRHSERNIAFVIFTSGSTGIPKGAMVEHRGMFNNLITKVPVLELSAVDTIAQTASQCFDISVWQFLTALTCGARIEVFQDDITHDPYQLLNRLSACEITILEAVPSMIRALLDASDDEVKLTKLRWLLPCGEAFPPELCRRWMARFPHVKLLNAFGPAECSDDVSYHLIQYPLTEEVTIIPVGRPVHNTRIYILNRWLQPVPIGVPGEIHVAGIQVGRGYLLSPDLTAASFIPNPFEESGERLYRTGDLGKYREDGVIEFLGRIDHQVKIRGFRIELGEIEARLLLHHEVKAAAVLAREDTPGEKRLVAYIVGLVGASEDIHILREFIKDALPDYMVPSLFVFLEALPLTTNGKVDRDKLPIPDLSQQISQGYIAPRNPTEEAVAEIWSQVLKIEEIGVYDNFFELGGHSLLAVQVLSRIRSRFNVDLPLQTLFADPSVNSMAKAIELITDIPCPPQQEIMNTAIEVIDI